MSAPATVDPIREFIRDAVREEVARLAAAAPTVDQRLTIPEAAKQLGMTVAWLERRANWERVGGYRDADGRVKFRQSVLDAYNGGAS